MDIFRWDFNEAKIVRFMEGFKEGLEEERQKAREKARELGYEKTFEERLDKASAGDDELIRRVAAQRALSQGLPIKAILNITDFDLETLKQLANNDMERGRVAGWEEGRVATIRNLLENGIVAEQIAFTLKMPVEMVKQCLS